MTEELWQTGLLDLPAYLNRIGHSPITEADEAGLRSLHRAHLQAISFENVDVLLGRTPALELDRIQHKLVHSGRGGYCYEQNLLFTAALQRLGYRVRRCSARVNPFGDPPGPRTHMMAIAELGADRWLTDVGFGAGILEPLPLVAGTYRQGRWTYRLAESDGGWLLHTVAADEERVLYAFTDAPEVPSDYEVYNYYTATHPHSPFTGKLVAMRLTDDEHTVLHGDLLRVHHPDGSKDSTELRRGEHAGVLAERFGLMLNEADAAALDGATAA